MPKQYDAKSIEVLSGLDPARKRPGMYTDTSCPNHLIQEVLDNSVDEAIAGHCAAIKVSIFKDGFVEISDDGRGMPTDIHPEHKLSGVELILSKLHAGAKFSGEDYNFSGGLHGVGVSVVNALSSSLISTIKRDGKIHEMKFENGEKKSELEVIGEVGSRNTGTIIKFKPDPSYFESEKVEVKKLKHLLKAKAVLCPNLKISFTNENNKKDKEVWEYPSGLESYLAEEIKDQEFLLKDPIISSNANDDNSIDFAINWIMGNVKNLLNESYVNLIPTAQGGSHLNGFKAGLLESLKEFCEFRNLLPKGLKLSADDVLQNAAFIISSKLKDPQFAGQTKERLDSKDHQAFVAASSKDALSIWFNQHTEEGEMIAELAIESAQKKNQRGKVVERKNPSKDLHYQESYPTVIQTI